MSQLSAPRFLWEVLPGVYPWSAFLLSQNAQEGGPFLTLPWGPTQGTPHSALRVGQPWSPSLWGYNTGSACGGCASVTHPSHPAPPLPGKQPPHPDPRGSLTLPRGPDFLSKVTLGATGAQWPIKPIDAERETVKQVTPRGHLLSPPPAPLRACGPGTCKQCGGGSVVPAAVPSLCWVRRAVASPGCIPRPTVPCPRFPGLTFLLEHSCPHFPTGSQQCLVLTSSHSVSHHGQSWSPAPTRTQGPWAAWNQLLHSLGPSGSGHTHRHTHVYTCTHTQAHTLTSRHMHTHTHPHIHTYIHTGTCTHRGTYTHTLTHRHTCTHTHAPHTHHRQDWSGCCWCLQSPHGHSWLALPWGGRSRCQINWEKLTWADISEPSACSPKLF